VWVWTVPTFCEPAQEARRRACRWFARGLACHRRISVTWTCYTFWVRTLCHPVAHLLVQARDGALTSRGGTCHRAADVAAGQVQYGNALYMCYHIQVQQPPGTTSPPTDAQVLDAYLSFVQRHIEASDGLLRCADFTWYRSFHAVANHTSLI